MALIQGRYDGGLDQGYEYEDGENEYDSGYVLVMN